MENPVASNLFADIDNEQEKKKKKRLEIIEKRRKPGSFCASFYRQSR